MAEGAPDPRPRASRRTRVVGLLKVVLPLVALGLLGAVIFWRQEDELGVGLKFSAADLEAMRSGLIVNGPRLSGASLGGDIYDFRAERVTPEDLSLTRAHITELSGRIAYVDGLVVTLEAESADIDVPGRTILLETGVRVLTSDGYEATAPRVRVETDAARLTAEGPVAMSGPAGRIDAARMTIEPSGAENDILIRFSGGVTLRYEPGQRGDGK